MALAMRLGARAGARAAPRRRTAAPRRLVAGHAGKPGTASFSGGAGSASFAAGSEAAFVPTTYLEPGVTPMAASISFLETAAASVLMAVPLTVLGPALLDAVLSIPLWVVVLFGGLAVLEGPEMYAKYQEEGLGNGPIVGPPMWVIWSAGIASLMSLLYYQLKMVPAILAKCSSMLQPSAELSLSTLVIGLCVINFQEIMATLEETKSDDEDVARTATLTLGAPLIATLALMLVPAVPHIRNALFPLPKPAPMVPVAVVEQAAAPAKPAAPAPIPVSAAPSVPVAVAK